MDNLSEERHMMPMANFGEKLNFSSNKKFFKLQSKGDKLRFRLLGAPFIEGKHFFELAEGWDIQQCPRVNEKQHCEHCDKYFSILSKAKKTGDKTLIEQAKKESQPWQSRVFVYYPVIDRLEAEFKIFQTTLGVRTKIESEHEMGTNLLRSDFVVMRTEQPGAAYYSLSKVDSADSTPLLPEEEKIIEEYKTMDLTELVNGSKDENSGITIDENSEVRADVIEEDINF